MKNQKMKFLYFIGGLLLFPLFSKAQSEKLLKTFVVYKHSGGKQCQKQTKNYEAFFTKQLKAQSITILSQCKGSFKGQMVITLCGADNLEYIFYKISTSEIKKDEIKDLGFKVADDIQKITCFLKKGF